MFGWTASVLPRGPRALEQTGSKMHSFCRVSQTAWEELLRGHACETRQSTGILKGVPLLFSFQGTTGPDPTTVYVDMRALRHDRYSPSCLHNLVYTLTKCCRLSPASCVARMPATAGTLAPRKRHCGLTWTHVICPFRNYCEVNFILEFFFLCQFLEFVWWNEVLRIVYR